MFRNFFARFADGFKQLAANLTDAFQNAVDNLQDALRGASGKPVARDDDIHLSENSADIHFFPVLGNDRGSGLQITDTHIVNGGSSAGAVSSLVYNDDNELEQQIALYGVEDLFDHLDDGETGTVQVDYTITDDQGRTDTGQVTVTIEGENDAPTVSVDRVFVHEDAAAMSIDLLQNYEDAEGHEGVAVLREVTADVDLTGLSVALDGSVFRIDNPEFFDPLGFGENVQVTIHYDVVSEGHIVAETAHLTVYGQVEAPDLSVTALNVVIEEGTTPEIDFHGLIFGADPDGLNNPDGYYLYVVGGADGVLFSRTTATSYPSSEPADPLAIAPKAAFDFEAPQDLDGDNVYELEIALMDKHADWKQPSLSPPVKLTVTVADTDYAAPPEVNFTALGGFVEEMGVVRYDLNAMLTNIEEPIDFDVAVSYALVSSVPGSPGLPLLGSGPAEQALTPYDVAFTVDGDELVIDFDQFADLAAFEVLSIQLSVTATGPDGQSDSNWLELFVVGDDEPGVPEAPTISVANPHVTIDEGGLYAEGFGISLGYGGLQDFPYDFFLNPTPRLAIVGGADGHLFRLPYSSSTGSFLVIEQGEVVSHFLPDFEMPRDANGDNVYEIELAAIDDVFVSDPVAVTITIADVADERDLSLFDADPGFHYTYPSGGTGLPFLLPLSSPGLAAADGGEGLPV